MAAFEVGSVPVALLVSISNGPPMELGTCEVTIGQTRDQVAGLLRAVADEVERGDAFRPRYVLGVDQ